MSMTVEQRDKMVCDLYKKGVKINDMISIVGVSQNTIYNVLHRNGIKLRTVTNAERIKKEITIICSMFDREMSVKYICSATNLRRETVVNVLKKFREKEYKDYLRRMATLRKKKDAKENTAAIKRAIKGNKLDTYNVLNPDGSIKGLEKEKFNDEKISTTELEESIAEKLKRELAEIDAAIRGEDLEELTEDIYEEIEESLQSLGETEEERYDRLRDEMANAIIVSRELSRGKTLLQIVDEYGFKPGDYIVGKDEDRSRHKIFKSEPMVFRNRK